MSADPPIPLEELLRFLAQRDLARHPDDYARIRSLFAASGGWTREAVIEGVVSLLATRREEAVALREDFRRYLGVAAGQADDDRARFADIEVERVREELASLAGTKPEPYVTPIAPAVDPTLKAEEGAERRLRRRLWLLAGVALALATLAGLGLAFLPRLQAVDDLDNQVVAGSEISIDVLANDQRPILGPSRIVVLAPGKFGKATFEPVQGVLRYQAWPTKPESIEENEEFRYSVEHFSGRSTAAVSIKVLPKPSPIPNPPVLPSVRPATRVYRDAVTIAAVEVQEAAAPAWPWGELIAALALLGFAGVLAVYFRRGRRFLNPEPLEFDRSSRERYWRGGVGGGRRPWLGPEILDRLVACLRYRTLDESTPHLDLPRTVARTVRNMMPSLEFARRRETMTVLLLVDENAGDLGWNPLAEELLGLRARGAAVERATFRGSLDDFFTELPGRFQLPRLRGIEARYLVLIVSDGKGLRPADEAHLRELAGWPHLAWLDPREARSWDESVLAATEAGLQVWPLDGQSLLAVFHGLLGGIPMGLKLADLRRRGLLIPHRTHLPGQVQALLAGAAPWAHACAMLQPIPLPLAERLRERFFSELATAALGRLIGLPDTRWTAEGLAFSDAVLALLRRDFAEKMPPAKQEAILEFLLAEVDKTQPEDDQGLASLAWRFHREKVNLEIRPDEALARLRLLAATDATKEPVHADLEPRVLPGQGDPGSGPNGIARIPLRLGPQTEQGRQDLARMAPNAGIEKKTLKAPQPWQRVLVGIAALIALGLGSHAAYRIATAEQPVGWSLRFSLPALTAEQVELMAHRWLAVHEIAKRDPDPINGTVDEMAPRVFEVEQGSYYTVATLSEGLISQVAVPEMQSPAGTIVVHLMIGNIEKPCREEFEGYRLIVCPAAGPTATAAWQHGLNPNDETALRVAFDTSTSSATSNALAEAILAVPVADRIYQSTSSEGVNYSFYGEIGPWRGRSHSWTWSDQVAERVTFGSTSSSVDSLAEVMLPIDGLDEAAIQEIEANREPWALPPAFFEKLRADIPAVAGGGVDLLRKPTPPREVDASALPINSHDETDRGSFSPAAPAAVDSRFGAQEAPTSARPRYVDPLGFAFRWVPAGTYRVGSPASDPGHRDDELEHDETIPGFWLAETEVTQQQWMSLGLKNPSNFSGCVDCPVEKVSFWASVTFLNLLSEKAKLTACYQLSGCRGELGTEAYTCDRAEVQDCSGYRLPTEWEWEVAARVGKSDLLTLENQITSSELNGLAWYVGNSQGKTHPVCRLTPNEWGFCDILGNVLEWTWSEKESKERAVRGGSWNNWASAARPPFRHWYKPEFRGSTLGFRFLVRDRPGERVEGAGGAQDRSGQVTPPNRTAAVEPVVYSEDGVFKGEQTSLVMLWERLIFRSETAKTFDKLVLDYDFHVGKFEGVDRLFLLRNNSTREVLAELSFNSMRARAELNAYVGFYEPENGEYSLQLGAACEITDEDDYHVHWEYDAQKGVQGFTINNQQGTICTAEGQRGVHRVDTKELFLTMGSDNERRSTVWRCSNLKIQMFPAATSTPADPPR